ncbi:hypothetical protein HMPREF6745_0266 [Prevotella sp. oral taxon 472 str. F0295]|nr:hypothetical protein HMPREF6745_0266 [Prevotella sp. oral taxon 472 str. F0295]
MLSSLMKVFIACRASSCCWLSVNISIIFRLKITLLSRTLCSYNSHAKTGSTIGSTL